MSGIPSWAVRGAKVVCVGDQDAGDVPVNDVVAWVEVGEIVTISGVDAYGAYGLALEFVEKPAGVWFPLIDFRPLVEPKSEAEDVALFSHHLTTRQPEHT